MVIEKMLSINNLLLMNKIDTICIIDDDPIHVFTTKRVLKNCNLCAKIITFEDGKVAYDALSEKSLIGEDLPDLILLDLNMPVWDGWDFLDEIKKIKFCKDIKIFITSSSQSPEDLNKSKYYDQVCSYIFKPFSVDKLKAELADL
jgi:CheY-like chemotaxis protein